MGHKILAKEKNPPKVHCNSKILYTTHKSSEFLKETLLQLRSHIDPETVIVCDFNTGICPIEQLSIEKLEKYWSSVMM